MRYLAFALVLVGVVTAARAQDAIPDLKGTWSGKGKSSVSAPTIDLLSAEIAQAKGSLVIATVENE
jgi:hypothetical protein